MGKHKWSLLACAGTEDRGYGVVEKMRHLISNEYFVEVEDPPGVHQAACQLKVARLCQQYKVSVSRKCALLALHSDILKAINNFAGKCDEHVILDITCFPKRFFFPFLRELSKAPKIKSLIVTYGKPESYTLHPLASNHMEWDALPGFRGTVDNEKIIFIGNGFHALGLSDYLEGHDTGVKIVMLFPFPPGPPNVQRTWEFVQDIEKSFTPGIVVSHVSIDDVSTAFDQIVSTTDRGAIPSLFAPYGPKTHSLAMCLYAMLTESPVYYTQPLSYHPDYTSGCTEVTAYLIKHEGRVLYEVK